MELLCLWFIHFLQSAVPARSFLLDGYSLLCLLTTHYAKDNALIFFWYKCLILLLHVFSSIHNMYTMVLSAHIVQQDALVYMMSCLYFYLPNMQLFSVFETFLYCLVGIPLKVVHTPKTATHNKHPIYEEKHVHGKVLALPLPNIVLKTTKQLPYATY